MAEKLGDAVLELRTDDSRFNAGIAQAEGRAKVLGATLDKTSGSSVKLAAEMRQTGQSAAQMSAGFDQAGQKVINSAGQQRAGMQQLSFQLNDIATMYALGARPMQIFASQSGQVIQAVQMMTGGTSRLAAFLGGPWGLAITSAVIVLTPFIGKLFEGEKALKAVEFASDKMADAQSILGSVIDTTTGKINTQSQALWNLARAQAAAGRIAAEREAAQARSQLADVRRGSLQLQGGMGGGINLVRQGDGTQDVVGDFMEGRVGASFAIGTLRSRRNAGMISDEAFLKAVEPIVNSQMAERNIEVFTNLEGALNGDRQALQGFMQPGSAGGGRSGRERAGQSQEEIDARFQTDFVRVTQQILSARLRVATSAEERAELQARMVAWDEREAIDAIAARKDLSDAQKAELEAAVRRLADREIEAIEFDKNIQLARDAQALADERARGEAEALQNSMVLADTEAQRKAIALRLLDAEERLERLRLSTIIAAAETDEAERQRAQQALANLDANAAGRRAAVSRANETEVERYTRNLNATPEMINEAIDGIGIDGLEALNDGLTRAIMGAESLGDMFSRVADQIVADLLRIAIQQTIIRPLATLLFGGTGGGGGGGGLLSALFAGLFGGGFANGGTIERGKFGIVGERGPELAFASGSGLGIMSNGESRRLIGTQQGGGTSVSIPINIDATGADAAALERVRSEIAQLREELPERIVRTVQDASDRRIINVGGLR